jgi:hypothetical protein
MSWWLARAFCVFSKCGKNQRLYRHRLRMSGIEGRKYEEELRQLRERLRWMSKVKVL